jgi:hypothetical protein
LGLRLKTEIGCGGIVEGGFHPQAVIWVIEVTMGVVETDVPREP